VTQLGERGLSIWRIHEVAWVEYPQRHPTRRLEPHHGFVSWEVSMTESTALTSRRGLGGMAALIGGALMIVSVWVPWLDTQVEDPTGWDVYTALSDSGRNVLYEHNFFDTGFSPLFSGLTVLIAGGVLGLLGLGMLASLRGGAVRLPGAAAGAMSLLALLILLVAVANLFSLFATGPGSGIVDPAYGLYLLAAGGVIGFFGVIMGMARGRS
jgi:hypothetical protein